MAARSVTKLLTSPSKVASALDWRKTSGSILSLAIRKTGIDMAIASHPSFSDPVIQLPSIPLKTETDGNQKVLKKSVADELSGIVQDFQVCGMVISWPVQQEGWCGASCGRVLHTLDQLSAQSMNLFTKNRPICLWDDDHHLPPEDEWGRAEIYSTTSEKTEHRASQEQYQDQNKVVSKVWNDFCQAHWPELYQQQRLESPLWEGKDEKLPSSESDYSWLVAEDATSLNKLLL